MLFFGFYYLTFWCFQIFRPLMLTCYIIMPLMQRYNLLVKQRTEFCTTARHDISDLLSPSLTYLVGVLCGQQVPAAWSYRPSDYLYCWQPCLSGCCSSSLERSARGRHLIVITAVFPASTKDSSLSTIVSTPDSLTACLASLQ